MRSTNKITILAELDILPGFEDEVKNAANKIWVATRKETGCEIFLFNTPINNNNTILFFEVFSSSNAFEDHREAEHTKTFLDLLKGKVKGDGPTLTFLNQFTD